MITSAGPGQWKVTFHFPTKDGKGVTKESVLVDARVPVSKPGGAPVFAQVGDVDAGKKELWALLVEKAYAKTQGSYGKITGSKSPSNHFAMPIITGKKDRTIEPSSTAADALLASLENALMNKKGVTLWTIKKTDANAQLANKHTPKIVTNHTYVLKSIDKAARKIEMMNPWGRAWDITLAVEDFRKFFRKVRIGG